MGLLRSTWLTYIVLVGCVAKAQAQATGFVDEQHAEASSIMQALGANMRGLECFDMTMTEEVFHIAPEGGTGLELLARRRYICNFRDGIHLIVASHRTQRFSLTTDEESRQRNLYGVFVNADERVNRLLLETGAPNPVRVRGDDKESFARWSLMASTFPDPRLVGMAMYPYGFVGEISFEEVVRRSFSPPFQMKSTETAEKNRVEIVRTEDSNPDESGSRWRYLMDMEQFVPLRLGFEVLLTDGRVLRKVSEKITWDDRDGLMVPQEIQGERRVKPFREWKEPILEHYDVAFTWHSVNDFDALPEVNQADLSSTEVVLRLLNEGSDVPDATKR